MSVVSAVRILLDADDPIERMLVLFGLLLIACEVNHFLSVVLGEITS